VNILLLGPQGSGKGTQAKRIAEEYELAHISTGDILRAEVAAGSPLGLQVKSVMDAGQLVSDDLILAIIRDRLAHEDAQEGFVLDGFPRNLAQADALDDMLREIGRPLDVAFELHLSDEECSARMLKRAELEGRADDTPEAIKQRLELYHSETEPLIEHYRTRAALVVIHAERTIEAVFAEVQTTLDTLRRRR
jgi:adenylate kinase